MQLQIVCNKPVGSRPDGIRFFANHCHLAHSRAHDGSGKSEARLCSGAARGGGADHPSQAVIEFKSDRIEQLQDEIARALGYDIVHHRLELYGRKRRAN